MTTSLKLDLDAYQTHCLRAVVVTEVLVYEQAHGRYPESVRNVWASLNLYRPTRPAVFSTGLDAEHGFTMKLCLDSYEIGVLEAILRAAAERCERHEPGRRFADGLLSIAKMIQDYGDAVAAVEVAR